MFRFSGRRQSIDISADPWSQRLLELSNISVNAYLSLTSCTHVLDKLPMRSLPMAMSNTTPLSVPEGSHVMSRGVPGPHASQTQHFSRPRYMNEGSGDNASDSAASGSYSFIFSSQRSSLQQAEAPLCPRNSEQPSGRANNVDGEAPDGGTQQQSHYGQASAHSIV